MFKGEKTIVVSGVSITELWDAHSDVANWSKWQKNVEWVKISEEVKEGTWFEMKPQGAPSVKLKIIEFDKPKRFVDISHLPLTKMKVATLMQQVENGVEIKLVIEMDGFLTFLWKNKIAKVILANHRAQNEAMIKYIKQNR